MTTSALLLWSLLAARSIAPDQAEVPQAAVPAETATVFIYHLTESAWAASSGVIMARRVVILLDGKKLLTLNDGNHTRIDVPAGPHTFTSKTKIFGMVGAGTRDRKIEAEAGRTYYLRFFQKDVGGGGLYSVFVEVDEAEGSKGVASTTLVELKPD